MKVPHDRRAELRAEALQRIAQCQESDRRRFLLAECVQAYLSLDPAQWQEFKQLLTTNKRYEGVEPMMETMFEKGVKEGLEQGREQGRRQVVRRLVDHRFGPLSKEVEARLEECTADQLEEISLAVLTAASLKDLGLD